jgi:metallo-beta-lactamase family protein
VQERIKRGDDIFDFPKLMKTYSKKESMEIHKINGPKIIIASSGMSVGGRIMEHEKKYLPDPKNCILFLGYQAIGSSGRSIEEGSKRVEIDGESVPVKAQIEVVSGYSSHMDSDHLLEFVANTAERLKKVFVVMGEPKASLFLAQKIHDNLNLDTVCPKAGESYEIIL